MRIICFVQFFALFATVTISVIAQNRVTAPGIRDRYEQAMQQGLDAYSAGRYTEAVAAFRRATVISPSESDAFNNLGMALVQLGSVEEAKEAIRQAVSLDPRNAKARSNLAHRERKSGRIFDAIAELMAAVDAEPEYDRGWIDLSDALIEMHDKSVEALEAAFRITPRRSFASYSIAYAAYRTGQPDHAVFHLREAIARDSSLAGARNLLGVIYFQQGRKKEASHEFVAAVRLNPHYEAALFNLALLYFETGSRKMAYKQYESLHSLKSNLAASLLKHITGDRTVDVRGLLIGK